MDLYEALKAGTSEEELLKAFHKDLEEATARIAKEEEEAADQEYLNVCREYLADAILDYAYAIFGEELDESESCSEEYIIEILKNYEKEMKQFVDLSNKLHENLKDIKNKNKDKDFISNGIDDDIISQFLKSLR